MRFFVSWYPGDPWYPLYDDSCALLISVPSVSRRWRLHQMPNPPRTLIIDSGGYHFAGSGTKPPTPETLFRWQLQMVEDTDAAATLCALDFPIMDSGITDREKDTCIHQTIAYAYEFHTLMKEAGLPEQTRGMAIVQGYDSASLRYCAQELKAIGFSHFGLGSLAPVRHHEEIIARVQAVMDVVGRDLHIFGIGAIKTLRALRSLQTASVDTARPAKAAMYNQVFYSSPFRYYGVADSRDRSGLAMSKDRRISQPLPCDCPICKGDAGKDLLKLGRREYVFARTLHNYWHLKRTMEKAKEPRSPRLSYD